MFLRIIFLSTSTNTSYARNSKLQRKALEKNIPGSSNSHNIAFFNFRQLLFLKESMNNTVCYAVPLVFVLKGLKHPKSNWRACSNSKKRRNKFK